ncbi:hypothetical protein RSOLAG22IIIB_04106 [Rhizoctonia solani]|uniref:Uncharacterized protein n=1 Tax=Rhizoctonia solani TaxID=456999 RepID=A0A0K6FUG1_9AGAM|nr:hypothetical protein RSOLAG22IIIB_04106 [Rhizoctonia solani]
MDYPCEECYGGDRHTTRGPELTVDQASGALGQESSSDAGESDLNTMDSDPDPEETSTDPNNNNSQLYDPPFDPLAREYSRPDPGNPHREQWIHRRSPNWIVVYDESIPAEQEGAEPELLLDVYDILRPCSKFPDDRITNRTISIPLGTLRQRLALEVRNMRKPSPRPPASLASETEWWSRLGKKQRIV